MWRVKSHGACVLAVVVFRGTLLWGVCHMEPAFVHFYEGAKVPRIPPGARELSLTLQAVREWRFA